MLNKISTSGFVIGIGSILNIAPVYSNGTPAVKGISRCNPDTEVLKGDWKKMGGDFNRAIKKLKK